MGRSRSMASFVFGFRQTLS